MCYLLSEGVVLGADSTSSITTGSFHYFNHNQKLFEIGQNSTLAIVTWGLGNLESQSHRTIIADFADSLQANPPSNVKEVADRYADYFYSIYSIDGYLDMYSELDKKTTWDASVPASTSMRTEQEQEVYDALTCGLVGGLCIGGRAGASRKPEAFEMLFEPLKGRPTVQPIPMGQYRFWGVPNMADRLICGADGPTRDTIVNSPFWHGTRADIDTLLATHHLHHPPLPIRDAIDFVHMCIHSTIKALKFSVFSQVCGGPIEICAITTDRPFRWVKHKLWDAALREGER